MAGLPAGSQPLLNWKLRQFNLHRREFDGRALRNDTDPEPTIPPPPRYPGLHQDAVIRDGFGHDLDGRGWTVIGSLRVPFEVSGARLAYRAPMTGLIDVVTRVSSGHAEGETRLFGVKVGTFRMTRIRG